MATLTTIAKAKPLAWAVAASLTGGVLWTSNAVRNGHDVFVYTWHRKIDGAAIPMSAPTLPLPTAKALETEKPIVSSFPAGYFRRNKDQLPDPTLEMLKALALKPADDLSEQETIYLKRARELDVFKAVPPTAGEAA